VVALSATWATAQSLDTPRYEASRSAALVTCSDAEGREPLPAYRPGRQVSGTIRVWGNPQMAALTKLWEEGFRAHQPAVRFENRLTGTNVAMAGLYTGTADLAFMGREATPKERMAFEYTLRYQPTRFELATGSVDVPQHSPALVIFVHKDNPLSRLTLAQLDAIFSYERRRGHTPIGTWDQLGLGGEWSGQRINLYGYDPETGTGSHFRRVVLRDSYKSNWDRLREFADAPQADGTTVEAGRQILDALARDRFGIAVSTLNHANPQVRPVALAAEEGGPWLEARRETVFTRRYPLTRAVSAWVNRVSGQPLAPGVRELLRYILSYEGQQDVARDGSFLPVCAEVAREQLGVDGDRYFYGVPAPAFKKEELPR
jgi:phosphate transport system substrate-binding protein